MPLRMSRRRKLSLGILSCFGGHHVNQTRRTIDPSMIGCPTDFKHTQHMGGSSVEPETSISAPATSSSEPLASSIRGRFIDLAQLRSQNYNLEELSSHFRGPGLSRTSLKCSSATDSVDKDKDITRSFLASETVDLSGISYSEDADICR